MTLIRISWFLATTLLFVQTVFCGSETNWKEVELKFKIINPESSNPKYELVFSSEGNEIAKRVYEKGKIVLSEGKIPDGPVIERYNNSKIRNIISYKNGERNGKVIGFYESGKLRAEGYYQNDNPTGIHKTYYENGNLMAESDLIDGKPKSHKEYYENGQLKEEVYYEGDKIIRYEYDIDGNLIKK